MKPRRVLWKETQKRINETIERIDDVKEILRIYGNYYFEHYTSEKYQRLYDLYRK